MEDISQILERLKEVTKTKNNANLSIELGLKQSTVSTWKARNKIPYDVLMEVSEKLNCSLDWLIKGEKTSQNANSTNHVHLPFYEISASAGDGALIVAEEQTNLISFEPEWLNKEIGVNPKDVFLMLVEGDSMYPTLKCGAMIMVNRNLSGLSDGIYVMRHDHNLLVKRLQMLPGGIIKVISDNNMYEPWEINKKLLNGIDIELIGRVVWSGQSV